MLQICVRPMRTVVLRWILKVEVNCEACVRWWRSTFSRRRLSPLASPTNSLSQRSPKRNDEAGGLQDRRAYLIGILPEAAPALSFRGTTLRKECPPWDGPMSGSFRGSPAWIHRDITNRLRFLRVPDG